MKSPFSMASPSCRWKGTTLRDQVLDRLGALLLRLDDDPALVLVVAPELHRSADLGDDRVVLRPARLEELRHPRQTAGDVARLGALERDTREHVAGLHLCARIDREDGVDREHVARIAAALGLHDLALLVLDHHRRPELRAARVGAPVDDDALGDAGRLVGRLDHRGAFHDVLVVDGAGGLGQQRAHVGIPLRQPLSAGDGVALLDEEAGAVGNAVRRALLAALIDDEELDVAAHDHGPLGRVDGDRLVAERQRALEARFQERLVDHLRRPADVEGAHGELRSRLADRLRRDDADRLAHVDRRSAREVAAVALAAHPVLGLAGQHRADLHRLHAGRLDRLHVRARRSAFPPRRPACRSPDR